MLMLGITLIMGYGAIALSVTAGELHGNIWAGIAATITVSTIISGIVASNNVSKG